MFPFNMVRMINCVYCNNVSEILCLVRERDSWGKRRRKIVNYKDAFYFSVSSKDCG